eukprot:gnl/Dysnectes_brevis/8188_a14400_172.p1 GENE.gnl/Dysnectes_brevis/8188_a14400_172~~gnl/Dysnectes_brevis/8188_a14400_172.p1  ORF type:complete len:283 (+),score=87.51 gnl/Dysnectes_brevis/8188_a14400_172:228-1076(+)
MLQPTESAFLTVREGSSAPIRLFYKIIGESTDAPPLVLVCGTLGTTRSWTPVLPHFKGRQLVLFDHRDMGQSTYVEAEYTSQDLADDTASLMTHLGASAQTPFDVLGYSLGGCVVHDLLIRHPKLVRRAVSVASAPVVSSKTSCNTRMMVDMAMDGDWRSCFKMITDSIFTPEVARTPLPAFLLNKLVTNPPTTSALSIRHQSRVIDLHDVRPLLHTIRTPLLVVVGDRDTVVTQAESKVTVELSGGPVEYRVVKGASHSITINSVVEMAAHVNEYLARVAV